MDFLITHPYFGLIPVILFGLFYLKQREKVVGITVALWLVYSVYEMLNFLRITCSGECNIRVDLLLIYPLLFIFSIMATVAIAEENLR